MGTQRKHNLSVAIITVIVLIAITVFLVGLSADKKSSVCQHEFSDYKESSASDVFKTGEEVKECKKCGETSSRRINATIDLPQLYLEGSIEGLSKTSECILSAEYVDAQMQFDAFATIKYQGHTAMGYDKKNFTIKFYEDELRNNKHKFSVNGWGEENKYCLKANYIDFSSARNIVSSKIWQNVVASRKNLDKNIAELEFLGGIDGFPFALFINNEYQGLYTFNIPKDEDTYNIADEENEAMFVINSALSDAANFRSIITEEDKKTVYDLEYSYPEDAQWPYESMNNLLKFVIENDGESFREGIRNYLDVDAAIDYLITAYVLGVTDNFAKNMILITYDGQKWIPNMYDLDTACGLIFDGMGYLNSDFALPSVSENGEILSGTDNLLWDRILNNFTKEIKDRYSELRKEILNTDNLINRYKAFIDSVPAECYDYEKSLYPDISQKDVDQIKQISDFMISRTEKLDTVIAEMK